MFHILSVVFSMQRGQSIRLDVGVGGSERLVDPTVHEEGATHEVCGNLYH